MKEKGAFFKREGGERKTKKGEGVCVCVRKWN
jgi:hypothetical protein